MNIIYCHHANHILQNDLMENENISDLEVKDATLCSQLISKTISENGLNIKAIYTPNNNISKKTAEIINSKLNVPIILDKRFDEYRSRESESWVECQNKIMNAVKDLISIYDNNDTIICVTSGVNIAGFINVAYGLKSSRNAPFLNILSCTPILFKFNK